MGGIINGSIIFLYFKYSWFYLILNIGSSFNFILFISAFNISLEIFFDIYSEFSKSKFCFKSFKSFDSSESPKFFKSSKPFKSYIFKVDINSFEYSPSEKYL